MTAVTENPGSSLANLEQAGALDVLGLQLPANMTLELTEAVGLMLGHYHDALQWAVGDYLLHIEKIWPEEASQLSEALGISEESRRQYVRVAQAIPRPSRRRELSWSHHRFIAGKADQEEWLERAVENNWTKREFEGQYAEATAGSALPVMTKAYLLERVADAAEKVFAAADKSDPGFVRVPAAEWELLTEAFGLMQ